MSLILKYSSKPYLQNLNFKNLQKKVIFTHMLEDYEEYFFPRLFYLKIK